MHAGEPETPREHVRAHLARAHVLPAGRDAAGGPKLGQGNRRRARGAARDVDAHVRVDADPDPTLAHRRRRAPTPAALGVAEPAVVRRDVVRLGGRGRLAGVPRRLADAGWVCAVAGQGGADGAEGPGEDDPLRIPHEMRLEAAQLAQTLVRAYRRKAALFREPHGMSSPRLHRVRALLWSRPRALMDGARCMDGRRPWNVM